MDEFNNEINPDPGTFSPLNSQDNYFMTDQITEMLSNFFHAQSAAAAAATTSHSPYDYSATCKLPSTEDYAGNFNFNAEVNMTSSDRKYEYSQSLKKIFVNMDINVCITFSINTPLQQNLFIRALPVFTDTQFFQDPVLRCCHHSTLTLDCNKDFQFVHHVIRCTHDKTRYETNEESNRMSVVVPLDQPQAGSISTPVVYKFVCKNSCSSGMNRRNTQIIFTLENINGVVYGRKKLGMRICSCPKRDKEKEEMTLLDEINSQQQQGFSRKKRKKNEPQLINDLKRIKVEEIAEPGQEPIEKYQLIISDKEKAIQLKKIADIIFDQEDTILRVLE